MIFQDISVLWNRFLPAKIRNTVFRSIFFHRVAKNTYWLFIDYGVRLFIGVFVLVFAARLFGPERFGILNYVLSFSAIFLPIAGLGLDRIIVRDLVKDETHESEIISTSIIMRFISGLVACVLSLVIILFVRPNDKTMLLLVGIFSSILIFQAFDIFDYWFQSKIQSRYVVIVKTVIFILLSVSKIISLFIFPSLVTYALLCAVENGLYALGLLLLYVKKRKNVVCIFNLGRAYKMIKESYPLLFSGLCVILSMKIGQIFIGQMISERQLGIYSAATRISETTYIIITATTGSVFPVFAKIRKKFQAKYYSMLENFFGFSGGVALAISISITLLAGQIIRILYGIQYQESVLILQIHIWSTIPIFLSTAQGIWNINEGYTHIHLYQALCNAFITILSLIIFMPAYGIMSVAVISVLSPLISTIIVNLFFRHTRKILWIQARSLFVFRNLAIIRQYFNII